MTGSRIGKLDLQGVVIAILFDLLQTIRLIGHIHIILHHFIEQLLLLLARQGRRLTGQRIEQNGGCELVVVIVGQRHCNLGKTEAIEFVNMAHTTYDSDVAIGNKRYFLGLFRPVIIILHNHDTIASTEFILAIEHRVADALIIDVRPFVASRHHHRVVNTHPTVTGGQTLDEFVARHHLDIVKAINMYFRRDGGAEVRRCEITTCIKTILVPSYLRTFVPPNTSGIPQNARVFCLSQHLVEVALIDGESIAAQHVSHQGRTLILAHRGELSYIAHQHQSAVASTIDKLDEIVEQTACTKGIREALITDHRGLVDHKKCFRALVDVQAEGREVASRLLTIDATMDGVGRMTSIAREHLGGTTRGGHQHEFLLQGLETTHHSSCQRGLTCTCRATKHKHRTLVAIGEKLNKELNGTLLLCRGYMPQTCPQSVYEFVLNHLCKGIK